MVWAHGLGMDLTLIEVMPMGEIEPGRIDQFLPLSIVRARLMDKYSLVDDPYRTGGPARYVRVKETGGRDGRLRSTSVWRMLGIRDRDASHPGIRKQGESAGLDVERRDHRRVDDERALLRPADRHRADRRRRAQPDPLRRAARSQYRDHPRPLPDRRGCGFRAGWRYRLQHARQRSGL